MRLLAPLLILLTAVPASAGPAAVEPSPLRGAPLAAGSGLRLLVADDPPFVLDVDSGRWTRLRGVSRLAGGVVTVEPVGGRAGVVLDASGGAPAFGVRGRGARVAPLGRAWNVWGGVERDAVWIQRRTAHSRCSILRARVDGRVLRAARPFPCATSSDPAGPLGISVGRTRVVDPRTGRTVFSSREGVVAVAAAHVVTLEATGGLRVVEVASGAGRRVGWPSGVGAVGVAATDQSGRFVALEAADPAWGGGARQVLDVWVLDTQSGEVTQLPGMPAFVALKRTSLAWTDDGRLLLLGETEERTLVAVWKPGTARLAVKAVRLPPRDGGSDAFAPLR